VAWRDIADSEVDPESPITTSLAQAWRDNPIGIANGDSGAPRISSDSAIDWGGSGTGTNSASTWVLSRTSEASVGAVGTYAVLVTNTGDLPFLDPGQTRSGSYLDYTNLSGNLSGSSPSGTWMVMGIVNYTDADTGGAASASLFLRVS